MSDFVVYLGRHNRVTLELLENNLSPPSNLIERVALTIPGVAFVDEIPREVDAVLSDDGLQAAYQLGLLPGLRDGDFLAKLTVYDPTNPHGVAWSALRLLVVPWGT